MKRDKMGSRRDRARLVAMEQSMQYPYTADYWLEEGDSDWINSEYFQFYDINFSPYYDDYCDWRERNDA